MKKNGFAHIKITAKSILFAGIMVALWYLFFFETFKMFPESEEVMSAVVGGFLVFSAVLPSFTLSRLSKYKDSEVEPLIYFAIIVVSLMAIFALMLVPYVRIFVGIFAVGGLSFVHCLFFLITKELDKAKKNK